MTQTTALDQSFVEDIAARVRGLKSIDDQTSPSTLISLLVLNTVDLFDKMANLPNTGTILPGMQNALLAVKHLRVVGKDAVIQNSMVIASLRVAVPFLAQLFAVDSSRVLRSDPYSIECRASIRDVLVAIMQNPDHIMLNHDCFTVSGGARARSSDYSECRAWYLGDFAHQLVTPGVEGNPIAVVETALGTSTRWCRMHSTAYRQCCCSSTSRNSIRSRC